MDDRHILGLALGTALIGLLVLGYASANAVPEEVSITALREAHIGKRIATSGVLTQVKNYETYASLTIWNESELIVFMPSAFLPEELQLGQMIRATGEVSVFNGELELTPIRVADVVFGSRVVETVPTRDLPTYEGRVVRVRGKIASTRKISTGVLIELEDETGTVAVPIFFAVQIPNETVEVTGQVKEYNGVWEVVPANAEDIDVL